MEHKLEIININDISKKEYDDVYKRLNAIDKNKYSKMTSLRGKHFLAGRYLLLNNNIDIKDIYYEERKPMISSCFFSISHSDDLTVLVIRDVPIGVDIEKIKPVDESVKKIINKDLSDEDFIKEFTKREAYIKVNGLGMKNLNDDLSDYSFTTQKYLDYYITISEKNK